MDRRSLHRRSGNVALGWAAILGLAMIVAGCGGDGATPAPATTPAASAEIATTLPEAAGATSPGAITETSAGGAASVTAEPTAVALAVADPQSGEPTPITFDEFYTRASIREGLKLSEKLLSLDGRRVVMQGYMAPPLKPELDFFVLTRIRLAYCPFCSTAAEWPDDIAVVYTPSPMKATERAVSVEGTIEVGSKMDQETGMVSLVRIYADMVDKL